MGSVSRYWLSDVLTFCRSGILLHWAYDVKIFCGAYVAWFLCHTPYVMHFNIAVLFSFILKVFLFFYFFFTFSFFHCLFININVLFYFILYYLIY